MDFYFFCISSESHISDIFIFIKMLKTGFPFLFFLFIHSTCSSLSFFSIFIFEIKKIISTFSLIINLFISNFYLYFYLFFILFFFFLFMYLFHNFLIYVFFNLCFFLSFIRHH